MKKMTALLMALLLISLCACRAAGDATTASRQILYRPDSDAAVAWANWSNDPKICEMAWNRETASLPNHLPIYVFFSHAGLEDFRREFADIFSWKQSYDEAPCADTMLSKYNEAYFEEKALFLVYVPANSGSLRFAVDTVVYGVDRSVYVRVNQVNDPQICTDNMAGWLCAVETEKADSLYALNFDAVLGNASPVFGKPVQTMPADHEVTKPFGSYTLTVHDPEHFLMETPMDRDLFYSPGTTVTLRTEILLDVDIAMYLNGVFHSVGRQLSPMDDFWTFSFEMPQEDVEISFRTHGGIMPAD